MTDSFVQAAIEEAGFLRRESERTGRRGYDLMVTPSVGLYADYYYSWDDAGAAPVSLLSTNGASARMVAAISWTSKQDRQFARRIELQEVFAAIPGALYSGASNWPRALASTSTSKRRSGPFQWRRTAARSPASWR